MNDFQKHCIHFKKSILEAITQLDTLSQNLTLFILDEEKKLLGTLTDGDIRRGFIKGLTLDDPVNRFCFKTFHYIDDGQINTRAISDLKKKGIKLLPVLDRFHRIVQVYNLKKIKSILPVDVVIMSGGKGERLRPLTDKTPKPLLKLGSKSILEHNIDNLILYGIDTFYISVNYLGDMIKERLGDGSERGVQINYIEEKEPMGTIGSLSMIDNWDRDVLLTNSDLFTSINYEDLYLTFIDNNADIAIASIPYTVDIPYAVFQNHGNVINGLKEKPKNTHYVNAGIYMIKKELLHKIPKDKFYDATDLLQDLIKENKKIIHNLIYGYWIDIGTPEDYKKAKEIAKHLKN